MKKLILASIILFFSINTMAQGTRGSIMMVDTSATKNKTTKRYMLYVDSLKNLQYWDTTGYKQVSITDYGAITQLTSATTTVVKNNSRGVITTVALTTAADASFEFTFTNSTIKATSVIQLTGLTAGTGVVHPALVSVGSGTCVIRVTNVGTAAFNALAKIHYTIL